MKLEEYKEKCIKALPKVEYPPENIWDYYEMCGTIDDNIEQMYECGFTIKDAVSYLKCLECVSPDLDEDIAIERMKEIRKRYV